MPQQGDVEVGSQVPGLLRRKPGRGTPTRSMSCSDKLAKWQLCGWQGMPPPRVYRPLLAQPETPRCMQVPCCHTSWHALSASML